MFENMFENKRRLKKILIPVAIVLVLGGLIAAKAGKGSIPELTVAVVEKKNLVQSVSETGTVEANVKVEYGWEKSGRVIKIEKKVGNQVKKGDLIATIDGASERSSVAQSVALLRSAEAALNVKFAGPTPENLRSSEASVNKARAGVLDAQANVQKSELTSLSSIQQAERALETAKNNLRSIEGGENSRIVNDAYEDLINSLKSTITRLNDALISADNILGVDNRFANEEYEELLGKQDGSYLDIAKLSYAAAKGSIKQAEAKVIPLLPSADHSSVDAAGITIDVAVSVMQKNLIDVKNVLNATLPGNNLSQTELAALKSDILSAQTTLNSGASEITNAEQGVSSARNSLVSYKIAADKAGQDVENAKKQAEFQKTIAEASLLSAQSLLVQAEAAHATLIGKPREIDIASLRAEVSRNRASVSSAQNELAKTQLRALSDGVLSKLDVEVGETVSLGSPVVTILSSGLAIKVDISESEISKIAVQDKASLTLDALGDDVIFTGTVAAVEPAETKVSGVVYYKTTVVFDANHARITEVKPGMTANVSITTDNREAVLVIPGRAVIEKDGKKMVRVVIDKKKGKFEEHEVTLGLKGNNGEVEVLTGLSEGTEVVTFVKENK